MRQSLASNCSQGKTTADRKYLLPDTAFVIAVKRRNVNMFSEVFDPTGNATRVLRQTLFYSVASGSLAADFKYNKEKRVGDKAVTTRVQIRHVLYVRNQPFLSSSKVG